MQSNAEYPSDEDQDIGCVASDMRHSKHTGQINSENDENHIATVVVDRRNTTTLRGTTRFDDDTDSKTYLHEDVEEELLSVHRTHSPRVDVPEYIPRSRNKDAENSLLVRFPRLQAQSETTSRSQDWSPGKQQQVVSPLYLHGQRKEQQSISCVQESGATASVSIASSMSSSSLATIPLESSEFGVLCSSTPVPGYSTAVSGVEATAPSNCGLTCLRHERVQSGAFAPNRSLHRRETAPQSVSRTREFPVSSSQDTLSNPDSVSSSGVAEERAAAPQNASPAVTPNAVARSDALSEVTSLAGSRIYSRISYFLRRFEAGPASSDGTFQPTALSLQHTSGANYLPHLQRPPQTITSSALYRYWRLARMLLCVALYLLLITTTPLDFEFYQGRMDDDAAASLRKQRNRQHDGWFRGTATKNTSAQKVEVFQERGIKAFRGLGISLTPDNLGRDGLTPNIDGTQEAIAQNTPTSQGAAKEPPQQVATSAAQPFVTNEAVDNVPKRKKRQPSMAYARTASQHGGGFFPDAGSKPVVAVSEFSPSVHESTPRHQHHGRREQDFVLTNDQIQTMLPPNIHEFYDAGRSDFVHHNHLIKKMLIIMSWIFLTTVVLNNGLKEVRRRFRYVQLRRLRDNANTAGSQNELDVGRTR